MPQAMIHNRYYGTGKRKNAVARVFLRPGEGSYEVNGRELDKHFAGDTLRMIIGQPFEVVEKTGQFDVMINVGGGGMSAQAEAVRHGISRALLHFNPDYRQPLKKAGFLTRDDRKKERKKPGQPGARKKFQYSKR